MLTSIGASIGVVEVIIILAVISTVATVIWLVRKAK
jgi:hypothetical protein